MFRSKKLRGLIPKRNARALAPPRLRASLQPVRIVRRGEKGHWRKWFLLGAITASLVAGVWFQSSIWSPSWLRQMKAFAGQTDHFARRQFEQENRTPQLAFGSSKASVNQPLPLGIALSNSFGGETLVLSGLIEGTSLSAGTALSTTRWSVPGKDVDKAFVSAPENFSGIMKVTATLYSSSQDILETKEVQFAWVASQKGDKLPISTSPIERLTR